MRKKTIRTALIFILGCLCGVTAVKMATVPQKTLMNHNGKCGCVINCMDARVQEPVKEYLQRNYDVELVDPVTEAGPDKILAENKKTAIIENIKDRVNISVQYHSSRFIAIAGHPECAGNPVGKEQQVVHLREAKKRLEAMGIKQEIVLLWVCEDFKTVERID